MPTEQSLKSIIIIIKTSNTGPSRKNEVVHKLLPQRLKHLSHWKLNKTKLGEATNGWLHPWTHPAFRCQTHCWENHSTFEPEPAGKIYQGTFNTLILQTPMDELRPRLGMSNSSRSRFKLAEQTVIRVRINLVQHTKPSHMTSMKPRQETLIRTKPGHRIHLALRSWSDIQQLTPTPENNTQGFGEQMESSNEVTQRCPQIYVSPWVAALVVRWPGAIVRSCLWSTATRSSPLGYFINYCK